MITRAQAQHAVQDLGWRYLLATLRLAIPVESLARAVLLADAAIDACGPDGAAHLHVDLRPDRVEFSLQTRQAGQVTTTDIDLARRISHALSDSERSPDQSGSAQPLDVQVLEVAIDALDSAAIRPFWKAVLGYVDSVAHEDELIDPAGRGPTVWFQQLDSARPQRNRIHLDLTVAHDEAAARLQAALASGGRLLSDARAPAFWILADAEGNEVCLCTWQGRD